MSPVPADYPGTGFVTKAGVKQSVKTTAVAAEGVAPQQLQPVVSASMDLNNVTIVVQATTGTVR